MYDVQDERGVPVSSGIPMIVRIAAVVGLLIIFTVAGLVLSASAFGHAWPANTGQKLPL